MITRPLREPGEEGRQWGQYAAVTDTVKNGTQATRNKPVMSATVVATFLFL